MCHNSVDDPPPTSGAQNGCLATEPQNPHFTIGHFKNAKVYKLQNKHISSACGPSDVTQFVENMSKFKVTLAYNVYT